MERTRDERGWSMRKKRRIGNEGEDEKEKKD